MGARAKVLDIKGVSPKEENPFKDVFEQIFELQLEQLKHDEKYHKEICSLSVQNRINHMTLHFAKYAGQIAETIEENGSTQKNRTNLEQTIIDIFVISLIMGNILNLKLSDGLKELPNQGVLTCKELGNALKEANHLSKFDPDWFLKALSKGNGKIAKACEKLDHLEAYSFKEIITKGLKEIFESTLIFSSQLNLDLFQAVRDRWLEVEKRSIFFGNL